MKNIICVMVIIALNIFSSAYGEEFYKGHNFEGMDVLIVDSLIAVDIDNAQFDSWDNIFAGETSLDSDYEPVHILNNVYSNSN